jgi:hypothetical protein
MLRPGGLLLLNWDTYLGGVHHHVGWDFELDLWLLLKCGMRLLDPRRRLRTRRYINDHPETLFFAPRAVLPFDMQTYTRGTSINAVLVKPGDRMRVKYRPRPELERAYFPVEETEQPVRTHEEEAVDSLEINARFLRFMDQARRAMRKRGS